MAIELEALVGHLYVVGGRAISAAPPGALVEVAPKKAARGRELDTFFALVFPSGDVTAPAKFYEQMAQIGAERYFSSSGSVTAGLRTVFTSLNDNLTEHNSSGKRRYEANMLCAVLRDDELYLARVGSGVALLQNNGDTIPFPADFSHDEALFGAPLGVHPVPDVKMSRYTLETGARLVLADPPLADMEMDKLRQALAAEDISAALLAFKALVASHISLIAAEFVPPDIPSPVPAAEAESTARVPVPETETPAAPETAPPPRPKVPVGQRVRSGLRRAALGGAGIVEGFSRLIDRVSPPDAAGKRSPFRLLTATGLAVLIPVVIVVLVLAMWLGGTGESEFELCVQEALRAADVARSIPSRDVTGVLAAWNAALLVVNRCDSIRAGDPTLRALTREGQTIIDVLFGVERRDARPIASFPNAVLTQVVLQGLDLYVLDSQNHWVYKVTLTTDGLGVVANTQQPIPAMRLGATIGNQRVANPLDIAWSSDTAQIVAIDSAGLYIACAPRFLQSCEAQKLLGAERWVAPAAITLWQNKLYILDPGANQIWRYEPSGGTYATVPAEYFIGEARPDIRSAVDFAIDDKGSVYILTADGLMTKWRTGEQQPFAFTGFHEGQEPTAATALFLNNDPTAQNLYITARATRTVYETSLAGTFSHSYRAFDEGDFALLAGVTADAGQRIIYVLSGNTVFALAQGAGTAR